MKIRHATADFLGCVSITFGPSDSFLSQLIKELRCGHGRDIQYQRLSNFRIPNSVNCLVDVFFDIFFGDLW